MYMYLKVSKYAICFHSFFPFLEQQFLYNLWYLTFSILGNINYFFFAAHLLDVAVSIPSLKTILQSVTHNGKQVSVCHVCSIVWTVKMT